MKIQVLFVSFQMISPRGIAAFTTHHSPIQPTFGLSSQIHHQHRQHPFHSDIHSEQDLTFSLSLSTPLTRSSDTLTTLKSTKDGIDSTNYDDECDVLILGSGQAARAVGALLSSDENLDVVVADSNYDKEWVPNYGLWKHEYEAIKEMFASPPFQRELKDDCIDRTWENTDCYFGGSFDIPVENRYRLNTAYCRIDKNGLKRNLSPEGSDSSESWYRVIKANHISSATSINLYSPANSLVHDEHGSTIQLIKNPNSDDSTTLTVRAKIIVDCTGHESELVLKDSNIKSIPPGYQIAYGALVSIDESDLIDKTHVGPYDKESMTLFDYRTDHFDDDPDALAKATSAPTFMYAMPLKDNLIFFEETSLVARPAMSFQECKDRYLKRMKHLGIKPIELLEEEFCYIPMGGPLPAKDQRIIGYGGAAAMSHPSTGYTMARTMMGAGPVAKAIMDGLNKSNVNLDKVAADAYNAIWAPDNIRQRDFAVFGGEFLMKQNVEGLRGFFDGFFRIPLELWAGFLAGWPGLPYNENHETWFGRLSFGLRFVIKLKLPIAVDMATSIATYTIFETLALAQSVTPFLGKPDSYEYVDLPKEQGDVAAKKEAMNMIENSELNKSAVETPTQTPTIDIENNDEILNNVEA